jgi:O-antigen/teichoic acid export membrane protein
MLRFSVWVILLTAGSVLAVESPKFLIGVSYGPVAVATVAVPMLIVSLGYQVAQAMSAPVFPVAARTEGADSGGQRLQDLYLSVTRLAMLAAGIGAALLAVFGGDIMALWVGEEYAEAAPILALLLVGQVFLWGSIPSRQMLTATRSIKGLGVVEIIYGMVCVVGVVVVLIGWSDNQLDGLYAVAAVLGIVTALHAGGYVPWFATQQFGLPFAASLWRTHSLPVVWGLLTLGAAAAVRALLEPDSIPAIAVAVITLAALLTAGGIAAVLEPGDRTMLASLAGAQRAGAAVDRPPDS